MSAITDAISEQKKQQLARELATVEDIQASWKAVETELLDLMTDANEYQLTRYNALYGQVQTRIDHWVSDEYEQLLLRGMNAETVAAQGNTLELLTAQGIDRSVFVYLDTDAVENIIASTRQGPFADLLTSFGRLEAQRARQELINGMALGWNPNKVAPLLQRSLGISRSRAQLIARTETLRAHRLTSMAGYRQNSHVVKSWIWSSAADQRTCAACWAMHGTEHPLTEEMVGHPNCRCAPIPKTFTYKELGINVSAANESSFVSPTGDELFAKQTQSAQKSILGPKRFAAYKAGELKLTDMVKYEDNPIWGGTYQLKRLDELALA